MIRRFRETRKRFLATLFVYLSESRTHNFLGQSPTSAPFHPPSKSIQFFQPHFFFIFVWKLNYAATKKNKKTILEETSFYFDFFRRIRPSCWKSFWDFNWRFLKALITLSLSPTHSLSFSLREWYTHTNFPYHSCSLSSYSVTTYTHTHTLSLSDFLSHTLFHSPFIKMSH